MHSRVDKPLLVVLYKSNFQTIENNLLNDPALTKRSSKYTTAAIDANQDVLLRRGMADERHA